MRRMTLSALLFSVVSVTVGIAVGAGGASARDGLGDQGGGYGKAQALGTWVVQVPQPNGTSNELMKMFVPGGGVITEQTRTALGSWIHLGRSRFAETYQVYSYNAENRLQRRFVIRAEFVVKGDTMTGHSEYDVFRPDGTLEASGEGPFTGTRYRVDRL